MRRASRAARTCGQLLTDRDVRALVIDLPSWARWAAVGTSRPGRGLGRFRRTPRRSCSLCGSPAALVLEPLVEGCPAEPSSSCTRHVERLSLAELASCRGAVVGHPPRMSWRTWWRVAPLAVGWRNAAMLVPITREGTRPIDAPPRPRTDALFATRRSLW